MPQINRVRVNNVKYNFGTQFYDDFMMRFNGRNTIYDLANGGGKSLLMLLILQNLIPNCTLDEKQPIEKLFRGNSGNTTIHSLVEWKLDSCYMKDNFKYMTTGFCARKGRSGSADDGDSQGAGVAFSGSFSGMDQAASRDSASVEYFNYVIFYREFGDNDIRNLPLNNGNERITYNGLKTYLRELEKKDFGVSVKIFERKGDYQRFISEYGLYESEWEIICGINKTEGHVRTYFETNYKTSRKVVEDLLIEEIIQKSFNNKLGVENDEGEMAKTLLDIKDKLIELSKKHSDISGYDSQVNAMKEFSKQVASFEELYSKKEDLKKQLYDMLAACKIRLVSDQEKYDRMNSSLEHMRSEMASEQKIISTAMIFEEELSLKEISQILEETLERRKALEEQIRVTEEVLTGREAANDYRDYLENVKRFEEIKETVDNRMRSHEDIINELKAIAFVKYEKDKLTLLTLEKQIEEAEAASVEAEKRLEELDLKERDSDRRAAVLESRAVIIESGIKADEADLRILMEKGHVLVAENADAVIAESIMSKQKTEAAIETAEKDIEEYQHKLSGCRDKISRAGAGIDVLSETIEELEAGSGMEESVNKRLATLSRVYNENDTEKLSAIIAGIYRKDAREVEDLEGRLKALEEYKTNLEEGRFVFNGKHYLQVKEYLLRHYGEDVIDGQTWYAGLNPGQKRDISKRAPFVRHGFVILNDFDRIKTDTTLQNFNQSSYIVPVISENIIYDMKLEVNSDMVRFAAKDLEFLNDEVKTEAEIKTASEEIETTGLKLAKLKDRVQLILEDYEFVLKNSANGSGDAGNNALRLEKSLIQKRKLEEEKLATEETMAKISERLEQKRSEIKALKSELVKISDEISALKKIHEISERISEGYAKLNADRSNASEANDIYRKSKAELEEARAQLEAKKKTLGFVSEERARIESDWRAIYSQYYSEDADVESAREYSSLTTDQIESRFLGLRAVVEKETSDIRDKETLMETYRMQAEKCRAGIEYRGLAFEKAAELYEKKEIYPAETTELTEIKNGLKKLQADISKFEKEIEAQSALMNRIEGSIDHGKNQIAEKYGAFERFTCENPKLFVEQHKALIKKLSESIRDMESRLRTEDARVKEMLLMEKDLERIVKNAGMTVPQNPKLFAGSSAESEEITISTEKYEQVQKEFEAITRTEFRRKEEFHRQKTVLVDKLNKLRAEELANEVTNSISVPETAEMARELINNIEETNSFIILERDRISKGIEDMERIKENFEKRCIQTCVNIRTELDRLPGLSKITLEEEVISIIGLQIPYIKEEFFKERMASYINETVTGAESFRNPEERLRYIRNRLTWKKLFSVIVTDMNAIRINLYKRERIKDQSRYLRYEEAVGSTGQSQGIYIQFLIAIINYISSINASSHENSTLGKVIFIDNPFGAAKDIYIWEPIFRLLKTNHVQLIVPCRGATPAITGRFEVNYVLGQKLSDGKQQTVVVDYQSQIKSEEVEYSKMDFEQTSLFDLMN